jgi:hypothetical protein
MRGTVLSKIKYVVIYNASCIPLDFLLIQKSSFMFDSSSRRKEYSASKYDLSKNQTHYREKVL